jgi:hypothetical protein
MMASGGLQTSHGFTRTKNSLYKSVFIRVIRGGFEVYATDYFTKNCGASRTRGV